MPYSLVGMRSTIKFKCPPYFLTRKKSASMSYQIKPVPSKLCYYNWKTSLNKKSPNKFYKK